MIVNKNLVDEFSYTCSHCNSKNITHWVHRTRWSVVVFNKHAEVEKQLGQNVQPISVPSSGL